MTRRRLARVFWLGAAAILVAATLISLVAVLIFVLAGVVATTGLLLTHRPALQRLAAVAGGLTMLAVSLTLVPLWRDDDPGSALAKAMGATWILATLAYLLGPVLQRWSAVGDVETGDRLVPCSS